MDGAQPPKSAVFTYATEEEIMGALRKWFAAAYNQLTWAEFSGSLGDLGTFLPLLIALVQKVDLDLGTTLIVTGLYNIASGVQFGIPMCVQPMKTIAAVALAASQPALSLPQLLHAGVFVSGCVVVLGATRLIDCFNALVPPPVVRGVQLAVGAKLAMKGLDMAMRHPGSGGGGGGGGGGAHWRPALGSEGLLVGGLALAALLATTMAPPVSSPGSPEAAEDGGLGALLPDLATPLAALMRRLSSGRRSAGTGTRSQGTGPGRADAGGNGGGDATGQEGDGAAAASATETSALLSGSGSGSGRAATAAAAVAAADPEQAAGQPLPLPAAAATGCGGCDSSGGGGVRPFPSALVAVVVGLVMVLLGRPELLRELRLGPSPPRLLHPSWSDLRIGTLRAGLPQLPLTTLNSVIAVSHLANSLFPDRRDSARWRPAPVALSVGLMNLVGCWLGAMPCCHGAGGLAAQHKFGARSGAAPVLLGCIKAALGLLFGGSLAALLAAFPTPLLGALLVVSGVELAASVRHNRTPRGTSFALLTAVAILALDDTGTGFLMGLAAVAVVAAHDAAAGCLRRWRRRCGDGGSSGRGGPRGWRSWRWRPPTAGADAAPGRLGIDGGGGGGEPVYDRLCDVDFDGAGGSGGGGGGGGGDGGSRFVRQ